MGGFLNNTREHLINLIGSNDDDDDRIELLLRYYLYKMVDASKYLIMLNII